MTERWKIVADAETYEVSDLGRVRRTTTGKFLRLTVSNRGYETCAVWKDGIQKFRFVHRLVLDAFVGPKRPGEHCRHLNGNKRDNRLSNLKWGTAAENHADQVAHGTRAVGSRVCGARLTEDSARFIANSNMGSFALARMFGVSPGAIWKIRSGRSWKHLRALGKGGA
jgi:hypothetical protein